MFKIEENRNISSDLPIITDNYEVLHFDEFPILFIGSNGYGNKILGSLACEDEEDDSIFRYFQSIVSNEVFFKFINKKTSYLEALKSSSSIFILDKDINDKIISIYHIAFEEIPQDYRPLSNSFCPDVGLKLGFNFSASLKGALADINEAYNKPVGIITEGLIGVLEQAIASLKNLKLKPEIHQVAYSPGSFRINLKLLLKDYFNIFIPPEEISTYVSDFIHYCTIYLPEEAEGISNDDFSAANEFVKLENSLLRLYDKSAIQQDDDIRKRLVEDTVKALPSLEMISDELGNGFKELEFLSNRHQTKDEFQIGFINNKISQSITDALELFADKKGEFEEDKVDKDYKISIYHLNTDTRTGNAYIPNDKDDSLMDKPKIIILGDDVLTGSIYTESLHLSKWISVTGRAKKMNGRYRQIQIKGDFK